MCRGESARLIKQQFLIDPMEASIFDNEPVSIGGLSTKILERKGLVWVDKATEINSTDCRELIMLMWVHHILHIYWSDSSLRKTDVKVKKI